MGLISSLPYFFESQIYLSWLSTVHLSSSNQIITTLSLLRPEKIYRMMRTKFLVYPTSYFVNSFCKMTRMSEPWLGLIYRQSKWMWHGTWRRFADAGSFYASSQGIDGAVCSKMNINGNWEYQTEAQCRQKMAFVCERSQFKGMKYISFQLGETSKFLTVE